jgi:hypothetical protein
LSTSRPPTPSLMNTETRSRRSSKNLLNKEKWLICSVLREQNRNRSRTVKSNWNHWNFSGMRCHW